MLEAERRIWDIDRAYFCPIVGFCLSEEERRSIHRRSVAAPAPRLEGIALHEWLVKELGVREGAAASRVERLLDAKHAKELDRARHVELGSWLAAAEELLCATGYGAFIWITAKYARFGKKENDRLYGLVHMYAHSLRDELERAEAELSSLARREEKTAAARDDYKRRLKESQKELERLKRVSCSVRVAEAKPTPGTGEAALRAQNAALEAEAQTLRRETLALRDEVRRLEALERRESAWLLEAKRDMDAFFSAVRKASPARGGCALGCAAGDGPGALEGQSCRGAELGSAGGLGCDLCERRVLIVGGLDRLKGFYRDVVNRMNGSFLYHDGDCHSQELPSLISQADVVLCPVDVNSHAACLRVKKDCKEAGKDYYMLRKSSVSTVYEALARVAANGATSGAAAGKAGASAY